MFKAKQRPKWKAFKVKSLHELQRKNIPVGNSKFPKNICLQAWNQVWNFVAWTCNDGRMFKLPGLCGSNLLWAKLLSLRDCQRFCLFVNSLSQPLGEKKMISCPIKMWGLKPPKATQQVHRRAKVRPPFPAHTFSHTLRPKCSFIHPRKGDLNSAFSWISLPGHFYLLLLLLSSNLPDQYRLYLFSDHQQHSRYWPKMRGLLWAQFFLFFPPIHM